MEGGSGSTTEFKLDSFVISRSDGTNPIEIKKLVHSFTYVESIKYPCVMGAANIVDSAGLINTLPICGGEIVEIKVKTNTQQKDGQIYKMRVWKISDRFVQNKDQAYTLCFISEELINNEYVRTKKPLSGTPEKIIAGFLKDDLKSTKKFFSEPCTFEVKLIAARKRIFDIIALLLPKSVALGGEHSVKSAKTSTPAGGSDKLEEKQKAAPPNSAGFLFWENKRGFNFFSVDTLCSKEASEKYNVKEWGPYTEKLLNVDDKFNDLFTIASIHFANEVDLIASMRMGRYSSLICTFNHTTGQYDEYVYNQKNSFENMKHLGTQKEPTLIKLGGGKTLDQYPSRILTILLDHELWYNENTPASHEPRDGATSPAPYTDWHVEYSAQSKARYETLTNQSAVMVIPGNSEICAGDRINIKILNKLSDAQQRKIPYDPENSGVYLIAEATHLYENTIGTTGRFSTTLRIVRDTHGTEEHVSTHANK